MEWVIGGIAATVLYFLIRRRRARSTDSDGTAGEEDNSLRESAQHKSRQQRSSKHNASQEVPVDDFGSRSRVGMRVKPAVKPRSSKRVICSECNVNDHDVQFARYLDCTLAKRADLGIGTLRHFDDSVVAREHSEVFGESPCLACKQLICECEGTWRCHQCEQYPCNCGDYSDEEEACHLCEEVWLDECRSTPHGLCKQACLEEW